MKCHACTNDISNFLQDPQVNRKLMEVIESLLQKTEQEGCGDDEAEDEILDLVSGPSNSSSDHSDELEPNNKRSEVEDEDEDCSRETDDGDEEDQVTTTIAVALNPATKIMKRQRQVKKQTLHLVLSIHSQMARRATSNDALWNALLVGLAQHGNGEEALKLFKEMENHVIALDRVTFIGVLSACSHFSLVSGAYGYFVGSLLISQTKTDLVKIW